MITLFGREREVAAVEELVDRIRERGDALIVRGAAGIGKSALLAAATARAEARGVAVAGAAGVQSETHLPFAGLHLMLLPMLDAVGDLPVRQREALLGAFGMGEATTPELFLIALAVLNLLSEAATRRPLLVVVDDAQWLDRPSMGVLGFVARRLRSEPIVLLLAVRDGYPTSLDDCGLAELPLSGLDPAAAEALLDVQTPKLSVGMRWRVLAEAAGNPLALVELPLALGAERPVAKAEFLPLTARLERAFAVRLAELPPETRSLLLVAAADDGHDLADALVAAAAMTGGGMTLAALAPAAEAGLVEFHEGAIRFRHPLVRSAIYQKSGHGARMAAHAALADVHARDPDRRAWHRAAAISHPDESVAAELEGVAVRARRRGAITVAVTALQRSAGISEDAAVRAERLLRAAELAFELGRGDLVADLLGQVEPAVLGAPQRARLVWLSEVLEEGRNEGPARVRRLISTVETLEAAGDRALALNFVRAAALRCWWADPGWEVRQHVVTLAERLAATEDDPELVLTLATASPVERGADVMERLARLRDTRLDGAMARILGVAATTVGAFDLAEGFLDASIADLRAQGRLGLLAQALGSQVWTLIFCGDWATAKLVTEESERLARETAQPRWQSAAHAGLALLAGLRGQEELGFALAAAGEQVLGMVATSSNLALLQQAKGMISLCAGNYAEAFGHLWRVFDPRDAAYHHIYRLWLVSELAEAAVADGHLATVRALMPELEDVAAQTPAPLLHVGMRHARALLAEDGDAEALYQNALNADLSRWPTARARLSRTHGVWLRRQRRVREARVSLRTARDSFDALGLLAWGERARQELRASGEASDRRAPSTTDNLTAQELQIARLAGAGLSNREIGQQLYLSHRTISTHLYRIFPKLGITSRGQLRDALRGAEPQPREGAQPPAGLPPDRQSQ
ncbi:LuxR family transcriptional regulator [Acrocarpospora sp. B8E8]|uniref:LuxR family transcriptional regulator n=1 Tax=Acrocarpospora sp. B8E8 TaxID=3153572 RepID=UPI00325EA0D5